jgi:hypothetical protein
LFCQLTRECDNTVSGRKGTWPWPGVEDLLFLKLVSVIFPTSGAFARLDTNVLAERFLLLVRLWDN